MTLEETPTGELSLSTDRLILKRPDESHIARIVELADNPRVSENLATMPHPYRVADAQAWLMTTGLSGTGAAFGVFLAGTGEFIGAAGYSQREDGKVEIGYWIGQPYWERGFATEAARAIVDFCFPDPRIEQAPCGLPCHQ